jgi:hypothetical protein
MGNEEVCGDEPEMIWAVLWFWLFADLTGADIITTTVAISLGAHEANPFLAPMIDYLIPIKFAGMLACIGIAVMTERIQKGSGWMVPAAASIVTLAAVVSNLMFFIG